VEGLRRRKLRSSRHTVRVALACAVAALVFTVAVATETVGGSDPPESVFRVTSGGQHHPWSVLASTRPTVTSGGEHYPPSVLVSTPERVRGHEALPCTGAEKPINFEIFSVGPSIAGVPLTDFKRRCGGTTPADEPPANFTNYFYGDCEIEGSATGCAPPLEIQTWPACQRSLGDYSYEGKPIPYRELSKLGDAEVAEIEFMFEPRIEVYTGSSTIVIFAENPALARKALGQLRSQEVGSPPATTANELRGPPDHDLAPPSDRATEGELSC
jgi:hypothetical protein